LQKKNAILHIRLAEALRPHLIPRCEECDARNKKNKLFQKKLEEKLLYTKKAIKVSCVIKSRIKICENIWPN